MSVLSTALHECQSKDNTRHEAIYLRKKRSQNTGLIFKGREVVSDKCRLVEELVNYSMPRKLLSFTTQTYNANCFTLAECLGFVFLVTIKNVVCFPVEIQVCTLTCVSGGCSMEEPLYVQFYPKGFIGGGRTAKMKAAVTLVF